MELHWRSNRVGKITKNLPFFKKLAFESFTKKIDSIVIHAFCRLHNKKKREVAASG
jgi:hypothetical protein